MNNVVLIGRLTRDPDVRYTNNGIAIANFTIAINRPTKGDDKQADFLRIIAFGKTAENCERYLRKGLRVAVEGRIQTGKYEKDGHTVFTTDIVAERVEFIDGGDEDGRKSGGRNEDPYEGFAAVRDDDIPF